MALASAPFPAFAATGNIDEIGGTSPAFNLSFNTSGAGWAWNAATEILTLDSAYTYTGTDNPISITAAPGDTITLKLTTGDVAINNSAGSGIYVTDGSLVVEAGTHTLTIDSDNYALYVEGDIAIESGTVDATSSNAMAIYVGGNVLISGGTVTAVGDDNGIFAPGDVTISGGKVTASGTKYMGICAFLGNVNISGGKVDATGGNDPNNGYALSAVFGKINISGGTVTTTATPPGKDYDPAQLNHTGGYLNGLDKDGNPPPVPPTPGGCDAGFGAGALLAAMALAAAGKKRRGR
jgi:hypothetical protein